MGLFDAITGFISGLRNYDLVPGKDRPAPPATETPTAPTAATAANGWSKSLADCHERLAAAYPLVEAEFCSAHPDCTLVLDFTWRSTNFQFELFKKGRELKDGVWVVVNRALVVTDKDGSKLSHHNVYPAQALDVYIRRGEKIIWPAGTDPALAVNALYVELGHLFGNHGLVSGATWKYSWHDWDHVQVDYSIL